MLGWIPRPQVLHSRRDWRRGKQWSSIYHGEITEDYAIYIWVISRYNFFKFYPDQLITYRSRPTLRRGSHRDCLWKPNHNGADGRGRSLVSTHNNRSIEDRRPDGRVVPPSSAYFSKAHTWPRNPAYVAFEYSNLSPIKKKPTEGLRRKPRLNPKLRFRAHSRVRRPLNSTRDTSAEQITRACATCHL